MSREPIKFKNGWEVLQKGWAKLDRLLNNDPDEKQFDAELYMTIYTTIYDMCVQKPPNDYSGDLYQHYQNGLKQFILDKVNPSISQHKGRGESLLRELLRKWDNHKVMIRWLSRFLNYLDRYYVPRNHVPKISDAGIIEFRENCYKKFCEETKDAVLELVRREREGEVIDRTTVRRTLQIFLEVGLDKRDFYQHDFEYYLVQETRFYYAKNAADWIQTDTCPDYLIKAEQCIRAEEDRVEQCFDKDTKSRLLKVVEDELLQHYEERLLDKESSGVRVLLAEGKTDDLSRLYRLFYRVEKGLEPIANIFKAHIEQEGIDLVKEVSQAASQRKAREEGKPSKDSGGQAEQQFVKQTILIHDKYMNYVSTCFNNISLFHKALKEAFESFCNKNVAGGSSAELIANYCDNLLKKGGGEKLTDQLVEEYIDKVVKLLAYISDKDLFAEFYRKKLARRLLHDKSLGDDHERNILTRLKQQCGVQFTSKMEGMVNDLQLAREKQDEFRNWLREMGETLGIEMNVTVLTKGYWPMYKTMDYHLPDEMMKGVQCFQEFYKQHVKHRDLNWIFFLGTCHLNAYFAKQRKELVLSTSQAALLLLFNYENELSYQDVKQRMRLDDDDATRLLHSLVCTKYKILVKVSPSIASGSGGSSSSSSPGNTITREDIYKVNMEFTDKAHRIRIPLPPLDEKRKVVEEVEKDRRYAVDAAIVRIMKSRKVMKHQQLVVETLQQLKRMFSPDFKLIKKRIEDLVSREYLERCPDDNQQYRYLA